MAAAYTARVTESAAARLHRLIATEGPIPFASFMEEALYGPGGYYAREAIAIGTGGDFVTGSSLSPLFGRATARLVAALDGPLGQPAELLEAGYGSGAHLRTVHEVLGDAPPRRISGWDRIERALPSGVGRVDDLQGVRIDGVVFSYELFDALPVHRLTRRDGDLCELLVELDADGAFAWVEGPLSDPALTELPRRRLEEGQIADLAPEWQPLYRRLADSLGRGLLVTCDYGFDTERLYDPRVRMHGTLACYRRQRVHRDPFAAVGEQDLTAHVDFSALIEEGERAGLETLVFTRQAPWLAACGLLEGLEDAPGPERIEALQLMQLDGMGEEIRVLVQGRNIDLDALHQQLPGLGQL